MSIFLYKNRRENGYSYIWFLILLVFISIFISNNILVYSKIKKTEAEQELFRIAIAYCKAINMFYTNPPDGVLTYPAEINFLLKDPRYTKDVRYLRNLFLDPITNKDFIYIYNKNKEIVGFYSSSQSQIIRKKLPDQFYYLNGAKKYSDLKFCLY
ncbi:type II secretion system protein [Acinetobacter sp. KB005]|uniref:type II secretion system protein n=1 Tax=Acinetobacter sp. KB005 TaxID=3416667 RepID=UPI003CF012D8